MIYLTTQKNLLPFDIPGYSKWYQIITTLDAFTELKQILRDGDYFEIQQDNDIFFVVHKSQKFTEIRKICGFNKDNIEFYSEKFIHSFFYKSECNAWAEYLI